MQFIAYIFFLSLTFAERLKDDYPFKLWWINEGKCLDGSRAGYYLNKGQGDNANKFIIYLQGGGWCYDVTVPPTKAGTIANCKDRSQGSLGSSKSWWSTNRYDGFLDTDPNENPLFYDWSMVYVPYCDGTSFSGNLKTPIQGLYFQGKTILLNVLLSLMKYTSIWNADNVILTGGSAGATAVFYHINFVSSVLGVKVTAVPDAGLFLDLNNTNGVSFWPAQLKSVMDISNGTQNVDSRCLKRESESWRCLFPQYYSDLYTEDFFILQSLYDTSEIYATLQIDCKPSEGDCSESDMNALEQLRSGHLKALKGFAANNKTGYWWISCLSHTLSYWAMGDTRWEVPANSGNTLDHALSLFLSGTQARFIDEIAWPNNAPCSKYSSW